MKALLIGWILKFAVYGIKRWVLKIPNWSSPTEVRMFLLTYWDYITYMVKATETRIDDIALIGIKKVIDSPVLFEVVWAATQVSLQEEVEPRISIIERLRNRRLARSESHLLNEEESLVRETDVLVNIITNIRRLN